MGIASGTRGSWEDLETPAVETATVEATVVAEVDETTIDENSEVE